jgi:hypothetical protein
MSESIDQEKERETIFDKFGTWIGNLISKDNWDNASLDKDLKDMNNIINNMLEALTKYHSHFEAKRILQICQNLQDAQTWLTSYLYERESLGISNTDKK